MSRPSPARPAETQFIEAWGRMGSVWGISRTMAEVHALLYIMAEPLCADDVMDRLQISRGNASMSLRALVDWGIVSKVHKRGDRKEYFLAEQDVWSIFRSIVRERRKREVDPLLVSLHEIRDELGATGLDEGASGMSDRLDAMIEFLEIVAKLSERFAGPTGSGLQLAATLLTKASRTGKKSG
ncbi:MAG: ArsR family transcriptional regulator [Phycisphaeraceae bacterium]|nr:ArsR family transcriptional regulator [Phycisphaeraceae bacterium]MCW5761985.1 ArsR family transcriptional regulator [Phycisphaeraceae bacterium]